MRANDSAQSRGLTGGVGHLDISSALPDSLVSLISPHPSVRLLLWSAIPRSVSLGEKGHHCAGVPAMTHFTVSVSLSLCISSSLETQQGTGFMKYGGCSAVHRERERARNREFCVNINK